jgi:hypothetical protein
MIILKQSQLRIKGDVKMKKKYLIVSFLILFSMAGNLFSLATDESLINIHGFVSQGYLKSDNNNYITSTEDGTFKFNEIGLNFSTDLTQKLRVGFQMLARDLDREGFTPVNLDWAYGDYRWQDYLGVRMGLIKVPYGLYNEYRDVDFLRTGIFLPQSVYNEGWRESVSSIEGFSVYGNISFGSAGFLNYHALTGLIKLPETGRMAKSITLSVIDPETLEVEEKQANVAQLLWYTPLDGLRLGFSWIDLDFDSSGQQIVPVRIVNELYGIDIDHTEIKDIKTSWDTNVMNYSMEYIWNNLTIAAEYTSYEYDMEEFSFITGLDMDESNLITGDLVFEEEIFKPFTAEGYYGGLTYRFTDWLEVQTYWSEYYFDKDDKEGDRFAALGKEKYRAWLKTGALSLRFDANEFWTLKLEMQQNYGVAFTFEDENSIFDEETQTYVADYEENWNLIGAKVTFNF